MESILTTCNVSITFTTRRKRSKKQRNSPNEHKSFDFYEREKKSFLADFCRSLTVSIYISVYKNREQQHFELFFQEASHML
jgi:hypothetical protein